MLSKTVLLGDNWLKNTALVPPAKISSKDSPSSASVTEAEQIRKSEREVAQPVGADGPTGEEPPMRDLRSLARRVRGYVSSNKRVSRAMVKENPVASSTMRSSERKALATLGRRGGKKAAERWKNDPEGAYTQAQSDKLAKANEQKKLQGNSTRAQVFAIAAEALARTGTVPTGADIGRELGVPRKTASAHLRGLRQTRLLPSK